MAGGGSGLERGEGGEREEILYHKKKLVQSCNGPTAGLGYMEVGLECPLSCYKISQSVC